MARLLWVALVCCAVPAWGQTQKPLTRDECICVAACAFKGTPIQPPGAAQCPPIHDELIYDNMARCACNAPIQSVRPTNQGQQRTSPNH